MAPTSPKKTDGLASCLKCKSTMTKPTAFRCPGCHGSIHYGCIPALKSYVKQDGTPRSNLSDLTDLDCVLIVCGDCATRAKVEGLLTKTPTMMSSITGQLKDISGQLETMRDNQTAAAHNMDDFKTQLADLKTEVMEVKERPSYAAVASQGLDLDIEALVTKTAKSAATATCKQSAADEKRARSVVFDNLPPKEGVPDTAQVLKITDKLGVEVTIVDCFRMGRFKPDKQKPQLLKVVLASVREHAALCNGDVRRTLRSEEFGADYPRLYIRPSLTEDQQHELFLLRRRRSELNDNISSPRNMWIVDSVRFRLWKKENGVVNNRIRDAGYVEWKREVEEEEARNGDNRGSPGSRAMGANAIPIANPIADNSSFATPRADERSPSRPLSPN